MKRLIYLLFAAAGCALALSCAKSVENEIKIGGIFPLSGPVAIYGIEARRGAELAISEINNAGGINGKKLVLVSEDDEGNPEKTVNAYKKLTTRDKVKTIIGSLTSGCTMSIAPLCQNDKVVLLAPAATMDALSNAGDYIFRACFTDSYQGKLCGVFSHSNLGAKTAAVLYDNTNDYSSGLMENFAEAFEGLGGRITNRESYIANDVDFNAQLTKIKALNPEVVFIPDYYSQVSLIINQLREQGISSVLVGADGWDGIIDQAGDEVAGGYYLNHYSPDSSAANVVSFVKSYSEKYSSAPFSFAALAYDCVYILKDAMLNAKPDDSASLRSAVSATSGSYVTGNIKFDEKGNPVKSAVVLEIVKDGSGRLAVAQKATVEL